MRTISVGDISKVDVPSVVKETVYTAVGLGILGFQQVQVQRQQLKRSLSSTTACEVARQAVSLARDARTQVFEMVERRAGGG